MLARVPRPQVKAFLLYGSAAESTADCAFDFMCLYPLRDIEYSLLSRTHALLVERRSQAVSTVSKLSIVYCSSSWLLRQYAYASECAPAWGGTSESVFPMPRGAVTHGVQVELRFCSVQHLVQEAR
ncbi:hypothetical protein TRVL_08084 [Trypanosoma vivax]|nr:hypothetical protein TRVL_08084 [Trypanosoma vivax]